jgi:osmoprotectant transport system ATP-binding protein
MVAIDRSRCNGDAATDPDRGGAHLPRARRGRGLNPDTACGGRRRGGRLALQSAAVHAIAFDGVGFRYAPGAPVLEALELHVAEGEAVAIVGRSGAGKSTLLRLVNRLALPHRGEVRVQGTPTHAWDARALRRRIGYVRQDVGLFPHLRVRENVALPGRLAGWAPQRLAAQVGDRLALVGLDPGLADRWPDALSGGQRQRVGIARALLLDPPVLLMDEPFGALDPVTRLELHREYRRLRRDLRSTILVVTHDLREAVTLADRIGVLDEGRLVALGGLDALRGSAHPFVRALLDTLDEGREVSPP